MAKKNLTVSAEGVFSDGVRQANPDPHAVAEALSAPLPLSLWVRDEELIRVLRAYSRQSEKPVGLALGTDLPSNGKTTTGKATTTKATTGKTAKGKAGSSHTLPLFDKAGADEERGGSLLAPGTPPLADPASRDPVIVAPDELLWSESEGGQSGGESSVASLIARFPTRFYPVTGGVGFFADEQPFILSLTARESAFVIAKLTARNAALGLSTPEELAQMAAEGRTGLETLTPLPDEPAESFSPALQPVVLDAVRYFLHTGQEIDILERSAADGKRSDHWRSEPLVGKRIYDVDGGSHRVELRENDATESFQGLEDLDLETLEQLTLAQDTDFAFAMLYVVSTLAPPAPLPPNLFTGGWIDLDDVMEKIGWYPGELKAIDREAKRSKIWNYLCYGNRAVVVGQRNGTYRDTVTGEEIPTRIESPIWRIMSIERPIQRALLGEVPRRVQVVISKEWEPLLVSARLAQYLPLAETVGKIPPQKVAGDWARAIALVLARLWRMKPQDFLAGNIRPTRRELLTHYTPKTKTVDELLNGPNPKRALLYWQDALNILCEIGFLAREGEAAAPPPATSSRGYRWQNAWLDTPVDLRPGHALLLSLQQRAESLPALKPASLAKKRGRPKKSG